MFDVPPVSGPLPSPITLGIDHKRRVDLHRSGGILDCGPGLEGERLSSDVTSGSGEDHHTGDTSRDGEVESLVMGVEAV